MLIEAGNGGGGIITTPLPSGILPLIESRPNHPLRCGGAGDPEGVTTEMQGHLETGKGNDSKDEAGRRRSGKALESSANTQKCEMWVLDVPRKDGKLCLLSAPTSFATEERLNAALEDVS